jgi:hypothetical protein
MVIALPLAVLALVVSSEFFLQSQERDARDAVQASTNVNTASAAILVDALNAETSSRGFALTRETRYLAPLNAALNQRRQDEDALRAAVLVARSKAPVAPLLQLAEEKFASCIQVRALVTSGASAAQIDDQLSSGKSIMDQLRTQVTAVQTYESVVLHNEQRNIANIETEISVAGMLGLLLGIVGSLIAAVLFSTSVTRRLSTAVRNAHRLGEGEALVFERPSGDEFDTMDTALRNAAIQLASSSERATSSSVAEKDALNLSRIAQELSRHAESERSLAVGARDKAEVDREFFESQLHQSQRLESLGQLAGGVAHDFNNLLAVILNYSSFVGEELAAAAATPSGAHWEGTLKDVGQIQLAAERASLLTRQLLSFARREVVQSQVLDLNEIIARMEQILRRTIGEQIELVIGLTSDSATVVADPGQIEQVVLNLAINSRDAMPSGGSLSIETATRHVTMSDEFFMGVPAGDYVSLRVSDSGSGMSDEVRERAFEPFFTTKVRGEGSGLGLATVYGIVKQSGGSTKIYSDLGVGTSMMILLPAVATGEAPDVAIAATQSRQSLSGTETVLVVDDEEALREVTSRMLARNGYHVLTASGGQQAIDIASSFGGPIDLLLTDVIMPAMQGPTVAKEILKLRPDVKVLYTSGHALPVLEAELILGTDFMLVEKPFDQPTLLAHIRKVLDHDS